MGIYRTSTGGIAESIRGAGDTHLPYHPEGNAINEQSHHTMNNMLYEYLYLKGTLVPHWVDKIPAIMLTLNSIPHQPQGYSTSMITRSSYWSEPLQR